VDLPAPLPYDRDNTGQTFLYQIRISSASGEISTTGGAAERYLGAFVRLILPEAEGQKILNEEEPSADESR
jgi:hypothetical protein